jgi:choline monooxygenase
MNDSLSDLLALYDEEAPLEYAYTIPAAWYTDQRIGRLEREQVFSNNWIAVGRIDQVASAGQFFTFELAGEPLIVVRGADGQLRGFYNVCRHHAAAVITLPSGVAQHLRCPYHGWTYGLDGSLKGAPEFAGVCNFDRDANGLVPVQVATWDNFVFVHLHPQAPALESFLGDLAGQISTSRLRFFTRRSYTLACNWKVYVDNYLDGGYHVPHLHKALNSVLDYTQYTIENGANYSLQSSPMVNSQDESVAQTRTGDRAYYYWLYPNFMINLYEGVMDTNLVLPLGEDKCFGDGQRLIQLLNREVYFVLLDNQGRRNHEVADPGLDGNAPLHHLRGHAIHHRHLSVDLILLGVEGRFLDLVFHHFQRPEETQPTHFADRRMFGLERVQLLAQVLTHLTGAVHQVQPLQLFDRRHGRRQRHRVRLISMAVSEEVIFEVFRDLARSGAEPSGT